MNAFKCYYKYTRREMFGQYSLACFDSILQKISSQTQACALKGIKLSEAHTGEGGGHKGGSCNIEFTP